jgi:type I restriction enzyme, S subunit
MTLTPYKLGDICRMKYGKMPPKNVLSDEGFPVFSGYRITGHAKEYLWDEPRVIVVARGVGGTGDVKMSPEKAWITNLSIVLDNDSRIVDKKFLFYRLGLESLKDKLNTGAAQAQITIESLSPYVILLPDLATQKRTAFILSAYDDLIENNRRRIQLLEQAARLLYMEWFVHLRFPGHEHVKIKDGVPAGWEKKMISEICETVGGGTPSTKVGEYWDGDITWVVPSDVTNNDSLVLLDSKRKITEKGLRKSSAKIVPANTILMTSRASVGYFALIDREVCTNQGFINIIPKDESSWMYLLFNLISRVNEIRGNAKGTTFPEISKGRFRNMGVLMPTNALMWEFDQIISRLIDQIRCLKKQLLSLEKARDLLLPRLMNGEIEI